MADVLAVRDEYRAQQWAMLIQESKSRANGIEPFAYLQHVLVQLPYLGKSHSHEELESLMPWAPYIQQNFAMKNSNAYTNTYLN